jgi:hypothetical protein
MQLKDTKRVLAGTWLVLTVGMALLTPVTSVAGWIGLAGLGFIPPTLLLMWWQDPPKTMSESIQQVLRPR